MGEIFSSDNTRRVLAATISLLAVLFSSDIFGIFRFTFITSGLDPSWVAAIAEQAARGASYGRDVIFTGGPLNIIYSRYFHPDLAITAVVFSFLIVLVFAYSIYMIVRFAPSPMFGALLVLPFLVPSPSLDTHLFVIPVLFLLARLYAPARMRLGASFLFSLAAAALIAVKFSVMPIVVLVAILLDIDGILRRKFFPHLVVCFACLFVIYVSTGSAPGDFFVYIIMGLDISAFYADAMSLQGNGKRLGLFILGAASFVFAMAVTLWRDQKSGAPTFRAVAVAIGLLGFLFLSFKAGFVRFDLHETIGWNGLIWVAVLLIVLYPPAPGGSEKARRIYLATPLLVGVLGMVLALYGYRTTPALPWQRADSAWAAAKETLWAAVHPVTWWHGLLEARAASFAAVKSRTQLPEPQGTVELIASRQSVLIANGANFAFRPTIQEYATFSPKTIAANRAFFEGAKAPDNLLLTAGSIDERYPTSPEGPLWPLFFSRYEAKGIVEGLVWLAKRTSPVPNILGVAQDRQAIFGTPLAIDADGPIFIQLDIVKTLAGRLASFAFRAPIIMMSVNLSDGRKKTYRIIPSIAQAGFMLSPLVTDTWGLAKLLSGPDERAELPRVTSITLETSPHLSLFIKPDVAVTLRPMNIPYSGAGNLKVPSIVRIAMQENFLRPPMVALADDGLFAHAPAKLSVAVQGSAVDIRFGIRDGAYGGLAATDGACFRVLPEGSETPLFERCLKPATVPGDRGIQEADIRIPDGVPRLTFETACAGTCAGDWTYWGAIDFHQ